MEGKMIYFITFIVLFGTLIHPVPTTKDFPDTLFALQNDTSSMSEKGEKILQNIYSANFESNIGQLENNIYFTSRFNKGIIHFYNDGLRIYLRTNKANNLSEISIKLEGSHVNDIEGLNPLRRKNNYFFGESRHWVSGVSCYQKIKYTNIYNNIDIIFYFTGEKLDFDFIINPGGNPKDICLSFNDFESSIINPDGNIELMSKNFSLGINKPVIFQIKEDTISNVPGNFVLQNGNKILFNVAEYNKENLLVIDPVLDFSTYFPGSNSDIANSIILDNEEFIYIVGETNSATFPIRNAVQSVRGGGWSDVFISKLNKDATEIIYSTYFGGSNSESGYEVAVDKDGYIYVTGNTLSVDFPVKNALQNGFAGGMLGDAFILKLTPTGDAIVFSTYFGGSDTETGEGIAVDKDGDIIIAGQTASKDFPVKNAYQSNPGGGNFPRDAFISKVSSNGLSLIFSTYFGGTSTFGDIARDVTVDKDKNIYVTGFTTATDFPTVNAFQSTFGGGFGTGDVFLIKLNPNGIPIFSTYLGGSQDDEGKSIVTDENGNIYLTGSTSSADFPVKNPIYNRTGLFDSDVFISKFHPSGNELEFSTYLGGSDSDEGDDLVIDKDNNIYVTGHTVSPNFTVVNPMYTYNAGVYPPYREDVFIAKLKNDGSEFEFSTFFGGNDDDFGTSIAVDVNNYVYITGYTKSAKDFPIKSAMFSQPGEAFPDAFIARLSPGILAPPRNLKASVSGSTINLSWDPPVSGNILSYNLYRSPITPVIVNSQNLIFNSLENLCTDQIIMTGSIYYYTVTAVYNNGESMPSNEVSVNLTDVLLVDDKVPNEYFLFQNYPNPFNSTTAIRYQITNAGKVILKVYDIFGKEISTLINGFQNVGIYKVSLNAGNLSSGIYFYKLETNSYIKTKKMTLMK